MYAHRTIQAIHGLQVQIDLPVEFADCQEAEIIVLPVTPIGAAAKSWKDRVLSLAGSLSDDFPDDIDDSDLPPDAPRSSFE